MKKSYNEILKALKGSSVATMTDYSQWEADQCRTGGAYNFTQRYEKKENGMWELSFYTSSVFNYCECCGNFYSGDCCSCNGEYTELTTQEVAKLLEANWEDPEIVIEIK